MTIKKASLVISLAGIIGAVFGGVLGWSIGTFFPTAYRGLFMWGPSEQFDPIEFGVGMGLVQGLLAGLTLGVIVAALVTWYEIRKLDADRNRQKESS